MAHRSLRSVFSPFHPFILMGSALAFIGCSQTETTSKATDEAVPQMSHTFETAAQKEMKNPETQEPNVDLAPTTHTQIRSADSHVHGGATLSIVSEMDTIVIELETPLYNLLGFEYAPQTEEEKAKVSEAEMRLNAPQSLMRFNDEAKCAYADINRPIILFEAETEHDHGYDHNHHDHHHNETHDHSEDKATHHDHSAGHKDVILNYTLKCENLSRLNSVDVELFEYFPNFTKLDLVYLGPSQQMSMELSPSKSKADLTR